MKQYILRVSCSELYPGKTIRDRNMEKLRKHISSSAFVAGSRENV